MYSSSSSESLPSPNSFDPSPPFSARKHSTTPPLRSSSSALSTVLPVRLSWHQKSKSSLEPRKASWDGETSLGSTPQSKLTPGDKVQLAGLLSELLKSEKISFGDFLDRIPLEKCEGLFREDVLVDYGDPYKPKKLTDLYVVKAIGTPFWNLLQEYFQRNPPRSSSAETAPSSISDSVFLSPEALFLESLKPLGAQEMRIRALDGKPLSAEVFFSPDAGKYMHLPLFFRRDCDRHSADQSCPFKFLLPLLEKYLFINSHGCIEMDPSFVQLPATTPGCDHFESIERACYRFLENLLLKSLPLQLPLGFQGDSGVTLAHLLSAALSKLLGVNSVEIYIEKVI